MMSLFRFDARRRTASVIILAIVAAIATTSRATIPTATNCPPGQAPLARLSIQIPKQQQSLVKQPTSYTPPISQQYYLPAPQVQPSVPSQLQTDSSNGWGGPVLPGSQLQIQQQQQQQQQQQPVMSFMDSVPAQQQAPPQSSPATYPAAGGDGVSDAFAQIGKQVHKFLLESGPQETSMTVTNGIVIPGQGGTPSNIVMLPSSIVPIRSTSGSIPGPTTPTTLLTPSATPAPTTPSPTPAPTTPSPTPAPTTPSPTPAPTTPSPTSLPSSAPTTAPLPPPTIPMITSSSTLLPSSPIIPSASNTTLPMSRRSSQSLFAGRNYTSAAANNANAATAWTNGSSTPSSLSQTLSAAANSNGTVSELVKSLMNNGSSTGEDQTTSTTNTTNRTVAEEVAWLMNDGADRTPSSSSSSSSSSSMKKSTNHTVSELIQWLEQTPVDSNSTTTTVSQLVNWLMSPPSSIRSDTPTSSPTAPPPPPTTNISKAPDTESAPKATIMDLLRSLKN